MSSRKAMNQFANLKDFFDNPRFSDKVLALTLAPDDSNEGGGDASLDRLDGKDSANLQIVKTFHVSSLMLANGSRFFNGMFNVGMQESSQKHFQFQVKDRAEAERVEAIIRFMYSSELPGHWQAEDKLAALLLCDRLGADAALSACCAALEKDMSISICESVLDLPESLAQLEWCQGLVKACHQFLLNEFQDFEALWLTDKFLALSPKAVCVVLGSDNLRVKSEQTVYQAASSWFPEYREHVFHSCPNPMSEDCDEGEEEAEEAASASSSLDNENSASRVPSDRHDESNSLDLQAQSSNENKNQSMESVDSSDSPRETCDYDSLCTTCYSALNTAARMLLSCLRLPLCSANFLQDVVGRDTIFLQFDESGPEQDSDASSPSSDSIDELFKSLFLEAQSWQSFSKERRACMKPPSTINLLQNNGLVAHGDAKSKKKEEEKAVRPTRFSERYGSALLLTGHHPAPESYPLDGLGVSKSFLAVGSARSFLDGQWKAMRWRLTGVASLARGRRCLSPSFPVDGYFFRLSARKSSNEDNRLSLFVALDEDATHLSRSFFAKVRFELWCSKSRTDARLVRLSSSKVWTVHASATSRGYKDLFKLTWEQLMASDYVSNDGALEFMVRVKFEE